MRGTFFTRHSRLHFSILFLLFIFCACSLPTLAATAKHSGNHRATPEFTNPVIWEDLADLDIIRVGKVYYYSASNMHYSPGAPILRSYDLVHWQFIGHSVPVLDFGPDYNLQDGHRAYVRGTWASFLGYRKANKTFYWGGCIDFSKTYIYTAPEAKGPWTRKTVIPKCYYDAGLLIDNDNTMYVAYGNRIFHVAQLSPDGTHEVKNEVVFHTPKSIGYLEGSRFYKVNGDYYIFTDRPPDAEYVLRSTTGPFGPYTVHPFVVTPTSPIPGGGSPHQGGIIQTQRGDWYYMAFVDAYPGGRVPVLAPMRWNKAGWPVMDLKNNQWGVSYPYPLPPHPLKPLTGTDHFRGSKLDPQWEWNQNPDNTKWSLHHGLKLSTATVTNDLYQARNTLTHRILGPQSTATIVMNDARMKNGDRAGLAIFRDSSAWVGVERDQGKFRVALKDNITMNLKWQTTSTGTVTDSAPIRSGKIWLRVSANILPGAGRTAEFSYSTDGHHFTPLGKPFVLVHHWQYFMGYRYAIFNYATQSLGGNVKIASFTMTQP